MSALGAAWLLPLACFAASPSAALGVARVEWAPDASLQWPGDGGAVRTLALRSGLWVPGAAAVRAVALGQGRAFVCMPRWRPGVAATLAWAQWPALAGARPALRPFPSWPAQFQGRCANLQSVVGVALDVRSRLWVLDEGGAGCPPKFLVFEWRARPAWRPLEAARHSVHHALGGPLRHLALDGPDLAYASADFAPALLVFSLREHSSWVVRVQRPLGPLALAGPLLLFTPHEGSADLLALRVSRLRHAPWNASSRCAEVQAVGSLLGPASGLCADPAAGALVYFLQRDHAVVSWDTAQRPVRAEGHRVLAQDSDLLPCVPQIVLDPQGAPWALAVAPNGSASSVRLPRAFVFRRLDSAHLFPQERHLSTALSTLYSDGIWPTV